MAGAALMVAGTGLSIYAQQQEAEARAQQAKDQAGLKRQEAVEILERAKINTKALEQQGVELEASQKSAFAGGNVGLGASPLMFVEEQNAKVKDEIALLNREAQFRAGQLNQGASILTSEANSIKGSEFYRMAGTALSGASAVASSRAARST